MTINDFTGSRSYRSAEPFDSDDPPRFGQLIETAKDAVASELRRFFDYRSDDIRAKIREIPTIEKFAHDSGGSLAASMSTVINLIMSRGDTPDRFPMVAITSASDREKRLGIGHNLAAIGQFIPTIVSSNSGPYALQDGWTLEYQTDPVGDGSAIQPTTILFSSVMLPIIGNSTTEQVANAVNVQALYSRASVSAYNFLQLSAGGPAAPGIPNSIEITGGTPECLNVLGFAVGQKSESSNYIQNPPKKRYWMAGDVVINLDVVTDDLNERTEVADLVRSFFTFYMERQYFQILGRSYQDHLLDPPEWYQLILKGEFSWAGEYHTPRQGGEQKEQVHSIRGSVPMIAADFINRDAQIVQSVTQNDLLPDGDYPGTNYRNENNR